MIKQYVYKLLELPFVYKASQLIFSPGAEKILTKTIEKTYHDIPSPQNILDVGCGPSSWLWKVHAHPVGLDISINYSRAFRECGESAVSGSAMALPFVNNSFDVVWTMGVLHHLPERAAEKTIMEMFRVCKPNGHVIILDAVLPVSGWKRPVAKLIRRLDRGEFMRTQNDLESLLPEREQWTISRFTYALTGLEMLQCKCKKTF